MCNCPDIVNAKIMIRKIKSLLTWSLVATAATFYSCTELEDPGPLQSTEKEYAVIDFDRLEMGSAFHIQVEQSHTFSIQVKGDRRNIDDLEVYKRGGTLIIEYSHNDSRKHDTYITIKMPALRSVNFSGASVSTIEGFESDGEIDFYLSGASTAQLDAGYRQVNLVISGASNLRMYGLGDEINAQLTGASLLSAFDYPVRAINVEASGASDVKVTASDALDVVASGASSVSYRGNPTINSTVSGSSTIVRD